jgi:hypothetical protein
MDNMWSVECWYDFDSWALPLRVTWWGHENNFIVFALDVQFLCFGIRLEIWND